MMIKVIRELQLWDDMEILKLIALEKTKVIGSIEVHIVDKDVEIYTLYVQPKHRKKGIGKLLIKKVIKLLINKNIRYKITLQTKKECIDFYKKYGFTCIKINKNDKRYTIMKLKNKRQ